jgi:hypothetical protein
MANNNQVNIMFNKDANEYSILAKASEKSYLGEQNNMFKKDADERGDKINSELAKTILKPPTRYQRNIKPRLQAVSKLFSPLTKYVKNRFSQQQQFVTKPSNSKKTNFRSITNINDMNNNDMNNNNINKKGQLVANPLVTRQTEIAAPFNNNDPIELAKQRSEIPSVALSYLQNSPLQPTNDPTNLVRSRASSTANDHIKAALEQLKRSSPKPGTKRGGGKRKTKYNRTKRLRRRS